MPGGYPRTIHAIHCGGYLSSRRCLQQRLKYVDRLRFPEILMFPVADDSKVRLNCPRLIVFWSDPNSCHCRNRTNARVGYGTVRLFITLLTMDAENIQSSSCLRIEKNGIDILDYLASRLICSITKSSGYPEEFRKITARIS